MGYCSADQMVDHFLDFKKRLNWDNPLMLHLGMDGPNLKKSFQKKLSKKLEENNNQFLNIGSCNLLKVHNAFRKGLSELNIDLDQFACDIYLFFKLSSARREDYSDLGKITEVAAAYTVKHSSTRWLSLKFVCIRILEQWDNLKQYLLVFLPKQKNFVREIKETARYKRIVQNLKSNLTLSYLAFVVFIAHSFDDFLVLFQSSEPLIHILYEQMKDLLTKIMSYFIKKKYLVEEKDGKFIPKSFSSVLNVNVAKPDNHKAIKSVDIGTKCKSYFAESLIIDDEGTSFRKQVVNFYVQVSQY